MTTSEKRVDSDQQGPLEPGNASVYAIPASFSQQSLWFLDQLMPGTAMYNMPFAVRMRGRLDVMFLKQSIFEVINRHEVLRTTFEMEEGDLLQIVAPSLAFDLPVVDLQHLENGFKEQELRRLVDELGEIPFDLTQGPLLRVTLLRLDEEDHVLQLTAHHMISDGWSEGVMLHEIITIYEAYTAGRTAELPELPLQYADFSLWQREWMEGQGMSTQLAYWKEHLSGEIPVLQLPYDHPRPLMPTFAGKRISFQFPKQLSKAIANLSRQTGKTVYMTLLAAWQTVLYRYSGQEDIWVGSPIANRNEEELEGLIGFFVNTLVMRTDLSGNPTFRELLERVSRVTLRAYAHQDLPFEKIVEEVQPSRHGVQNPLFNVMFVLQNAPMGELRLPNLTMSTLETEGTTAKFDLLLSMAEVGEDLLGSLEYSTELFEEETIRRMIAHFEQLLTNAVANSECSIAELPILTEAERHQLLGEWKEGIGDALQTSCIHNWFETQAEKTPNAVAVVYEQQSLTYRELNEKANQVAHTLQKRGIRPDRLVAICMERSLELIVGLLGILKAGGAYLPLDPTSPSDRIAFVLADAEATVLITQKHLAEQLPAHQAQVLCLDADSEQIALERVDNPESGVTPDHVAYVIYTSGSTGQPKGVLIPHRNVTRLFGATEDWYGFSDTDVWTLFHSYAFDFSVWEIWGALLYGGKLVVVPYLVSRSPEAFYELLIQERVTVLNQTPSAFQQLLQMDAASGAKNELALRYVIFGGEAVELQMLRPWFERHGDHHPQLVNMYGITETTVHVTYRPITQHDLEEGLGSMIGVPIPDLRLYVLDAHLQPMPFGVTGEMYVGGAGLARGYLNRPELTAERFVDSPYGRLYKTGDLARRFANGELEYQGRIDNQVKIRGFRIELGEISAVLTTHPAVSQAVVTVYTDANGHKNLVAYVLPVGEQELAPAELRKYLQSKLLSHMIPAFYVVLREFPLTTNGKVDMKKLPIPDLDALERVVYVAPRNRTEEILADVFAEVLDTEQVGVQDNYFALGGDSIRSIRVVSRAKELGVVIEIQDLFQHQTIEELAMYARMEEQTSAWVATKPFELIGEEDRSQLPEEVEDAYPLAQLQQGMLFHSQLDADGSVYHNVISFHVRGPFDPSAIQQAIARLIERHPVLRTSFDLVRYSEPLQLVHREVPTPVTMEDLRQLSDVEQEERIQQRFAEEINTHFDWSRPPLIRFHVQRRTNDTFQMFFTEHHVITDGWSVASLLTELFITYNMLVRGEEISVANVLDVQYREFILLERQALASDEQRMYWQQELEDFVFTKIERLPHERAAVMMPKMRSRALPIASETATGLNRLAQLSNAPIRDVLLAAHCFVHSKISGHDEIVTGVVVNGRPEQSQAEQVIGLHLNTLPYRIAMPNGNWIDLVRTVFATGNRSFPYRRYPMAQIQRDLGGQKIFEMGFNYINFHVYDTLNGNNDLEVLSMRDCIFTDFPLFVSFNLNAEGQLTLRLEWDATEFGDEQIDLLFGYFERTLTAMADEPTALLKTCSVLSESQRQQLLVNWNDTHRVYPNSMCLHELFEQQVVRTPDAVAVVFEGQQLTYREVNERANQLVHYLQKVGVEPEMMVGICLERSLEMVVGLLAALKAGVAYVPLDPSYPAERLAFMLEDTQVPVLLTQQHLVDTLPAHQAHVICLDRDWAAIAEMSGEKVEVPVKPDDVAYVIYTSGSTGKPKGVMIPHHAICNHMFWMQSAYPLTSTDKVLQKTPFGFDASVWEFWAPLLAGAQLVMAKPGGHQDPHYMIQTVIEQGITILQLVPTMLLMMLEHSEMTNCTSLRHVFCGGEALALELQERFFQCLSAELHNLYGPTETCIDATVWDCQPEPNAKIVPIGRPIANTQVYVLDAHLQPLPVGVPGELYIGGHGLARGYLNRPDLTSERFVANPFSEDVASRLYKTGDLARFLPNGSIQYLGRLDHQVKIRGQRVELGEIEETLLQHPDVQEAVVTVIEVREEQPSDMRLMAYLVPHEQSILDEQELRRFVKQTLPDYMAPSHYMILDKLPLTTNGKVDRRALPKPTDLSIARETAYVPPRDTLELHLVHIWEEMLGVSGIGVRDNFFQIGGHSLLAVQVMTAVSKQFGKNLSLISLYQEGTIEHLAGLLRQEGDVMQTSHLLKLKTGQGQTPLFLVHPVAGLVNGYMKLVHELGDRPIYGLQSSGLQENQKMLTSVVEMASAYVEDIRIVQPQGPYLLAGWSFGGLVAFEMAQQLQSLGQEVAFLGLFDTLKPGVVQEAQLPSENELLLEFVIDLAIYLKWEFDLAAMERLPVVEGLREVYEAARHLEKLPPHSGFADFVRFFEVFKVNRYAGGDYVPTHYAGRVTLFRAREDKEEVLLQHPAFGWEDLVQDMQVHDVSSNHFTMMQAPHVQTIAEQMRASLSEELEKTGARSAGLEL